MILAKITFNEYCSNGRFLEVGSDGDELLGVLLKLPKIEDGPGLLAWWLYMFGVDEEEAAED